MSLPEQYELVEELERYLGAPADASCLFSFARSVELDERGEYPAEACGLLDEWGLQEFYVPEEAGGRLASYEQLLAFWRVVARRDLSVVVAHCKTFMGSVLVWVFGSREQRERLAAVVKARGQVALAYHERAHGSDFMATEMAARRTAEGFVLDGSKWLVNNATRSAALTLFARTKEEGGARGFSLFLVEKSGLDPDSYGYLPRVKTLGVRGGQVAGIRFKDCLLGEDALIGAEGAGLEQTLKAFQITRTLLPGLSLGAADTALRTTLDFALERQLYGTSVFDIPHARRQLVGAFVDLLACECMAVACSRALHQTPEQMRLYSAAVKYYVPTAVETLVNELSVVLGARQYLREGHCWGVFQKLIRDNGVLSVFHAGTFLTQITVALHLRDLARQRAKGSGSDSDELRARLSAIFDLRAPLAPFDPEGLRVYTRGRDDFMQGLGPALETLEDLRPGAGVDSQVLSEIVGLTTGLLRQVEREDETLRELDLGGADGESPEMFEQAKRYCTLTAAAACVHMWLHNRESLGTFFGRGEWLVLCLHRLLNQLRPATEPWPRAYFESVAAQLVELHEEGKLFSILPLRLARAEKAAGHSAPTR